MTHQIAINRRKLTELRADVARSLEKQGGPPLPEIDPAAWGAFDRDRDTDELVENALRGEDRETLRWVIEQWPGHKSMPLSLQRYMRAALLSKDPAHQVRRRRGRGRDAGEEEWRKFCCAAIVAHYIACGADEHKAYKTCAPMLGFSTVDALKNACAGGPRRFLKQLGQPTLTRLLIDAWDKAERPTTVRFQWLLHACDWLLERDLNRG